MEKGIIIVQGDSRILHHLKVYKSNQEAREVIQGDDLFTQEIDISSIRKQEKERVRELRAFIESHRNNNMIYIYCDYLEGEINNIFRNKE